MSDSKNHVLWYNVKSICKYGRFKILATHVSIRTYDMICIT